MLPSPMMMEAETELRLVKKYDKSNEHTEQYPDENWIEKHGSGELKFNLWIFKTFTTFLDGIILLRQDRQKFITWTVLH